jgi:hypothetical protein
MYCTTLIFAVLMDAADAENPVIFRFASLAVKHKEHFPSSLCSCSHVLISSSPAHGAGIATPIAESSSLCAATLTKDERARSRSWARRSRFTSEESTLGRHRISLTSTSLFFCYSRTSTTLPHSFGRLVHPSTLCHFALIALSPTNRSLHTAHRAGVTRA